MKSVARRHPPPGRAASTPPLPIWTQCSLNDPPELRPVTLSALFPIRPSARRRRDSLNLAGAMVLGRAAGPTHNFGGKTSGLT